MDASAYLHKHGWRGDGYSLGDLNKGIKKPLLISKKVDVLGVGLNRHSAVSDQWWLRAFDQGLRNLGSGNQTALQQVQKHGVGRGGLYGHFVKGQPIPGTLPDFPSSTQIDPDPIIRTSSLSKNGSVAPTASGRKRKHGDRADKKRSRHKSDESESHPQTGQMLGKIKRQEHTQEISIQTQPSVLRRKDLSATKLAEYQKRAAAKGVELELYIRRREEKYAAKKATRASASG